MESTKKSRLVSSVVFFLTIAMLQSSCSGKDNKNLTDDEFVVVFQEAFNIAVIENKLTDAKTTKSASGKYRFFSKDSIMLDLLNRIKGDSIEILKESELCNLRLNENFLSPKILKVSSDTLEIQLSTICVYNEGDTCVVDVGLCGGGMFFKFVKENNNWRQGEIRGWSD